ncbi:hypothetical protein [Spirosoma foliorum]|uniref:Uncharacterized protein n=1 Tax=Spirosoma foliorum TaxID=2710596 RepID=A0A7G5GYE0_9BACT|nr:hypothetical protein [Spirosoma foliorum]QMW03882.1 hypothetical protein H3H32_02690 [Spirosoma foliorum]
MVSSSISPRGRWVAGQSNAYLPAFRRQVSRPATGRFRLIWRLPLTSKTPRQSGFDKLGGLGATAQTPWWLRLDRNGFVPLLSFANRPKNRIVRFTRSAWAGYR